MDIIEEKFPHYDPAGQEMVRKAYEIASRALAEDKRSDGSPFIGHPMGVALIASDEIALPAECVAAVFLHETQRMHPDADIRQEPFSHDIYTMVDGLNKISTIKPKDTRLEAENYKKLIVQYSTDPRVAVLKIADRLEVMRHLDMFPKSSRENKILETLMLYIPLAHQLGLYNIKSEMENIYFRFAEPEQYRAITNSLKATEKDRIALTAQFIEPLKKKLSDAGIRYKLKIRTKTAWSIWKKMQKQKVDFDGVYDVFAIRFIIDCDGGHEEELNLCWKVYSFVTEEYTPDMNRYRDWLTNPKPNGYESLHITVSNREGANIEVQIRTKRMDDEAENGHASHWSYKGIKHDEMMDRWLLSVRNTLEHPGLVKDEDIPLPPSREIFVFTPTGELKILPAGASILDFAFMIHTGIGSRCTGGKINGKVVPIKETLKTGDVVEILTSKNQHPTSSWLSAVVTSKARTKIRQLLNEDEYKKAASGKELLSRRLKNWKLTLKDELLHDIMKKLKYPTVNSFYAAVGDETIDVNTIKTYLLDHIKQQQNTENTTEITHDAWTGEREQAGSDDILVLNAKDLKGLDYKMAKCCHPVYGDNVFGFVTRTEGIKIHRMSCPNASRLIAAYPYRIQKVRWANTPSSGNFQAGLRITAGMETQVINQIMDIVGSFKASVRSFSVSENARNSTYDITLKIAVPSHLELDKVISQIRLLKNVIKINRS